MNLIRLWYLNDDVAVFFISSVIGIINLSVSAAKVRSKKIQQWSNWTNIILFLPQQSLQRFVI